MVACIVGLTFNIIACIYFVQTRRKDLCDYLLMNLITADMTLTGTAIVLYAILLMLDSSDPSSVRVTVIMAGVAGYIAVLSGFITFSIVLMRSYVLYTNTSRYHLPNKVVYFLLVLASLLLFAAFVAVSIRQFDPVDTRTITTSYMAMVLVVCSLIALALIPMTVQLVRKNTSFDEDDGKAATLAGLFGATYVITSVPMIAWFFVPKKSPLLGPAIYLLVVSFSSIMNPIIFMFRDSAMRLYVKNNAGGSSSYGNNYAAGHGCDYTTAYDDCEC